MDDIRRIDAQTARRFMVERHLLTTPRALEAGPDGVRAAFRRLGSVQFDPLGVAGRNHDLVLHARVRDYASAWTDSLLYGTRELFEAYNKGLSLLPMAELPWYRVSWESSEYRSGVLATHADAVAAILERIRLEGPLSSLDFERKPAIDWWWGPTSEARALLEGLSASGILGLSRRAGNRRYFDLMERLVPPELLALRPSEHDQRRHKLLSRYRAHGLLGATGSGELWYGTGKGRRDTGDTPETIVRAELRDEFVADGDLIPVAIDGLSGYRYILGTEEQLLDEAGRQRTAPTPEVTFLAALDPFVWDRDLLRALYDFDYVWEVYVPEHKRRWGYYVLPILFGDRLVGRIEPRIDRAATTVRVLGLWWEEWFDPRTADGFVPAMRAALAAYLRFGGVRSVDWAPHLGAARRLIGTRPRG
ncbi:MAG: winged helix DNA-binding domain-containing protein [Chloroflexi bacterium]|nr:winged helix DNA-binding domain-containing protein [Chloroflexota bacterium]